MTAIRSRRAAACLLPVVLLTAGCSKDKKEPATTTTLAPTTAPTESTTTTVPFTKESIVLAGDGLGPALPFGTNAAKTIGSLIQALGNPEKNTPLPVGQPCGATRRLTWANFQVLVNEVGVTSNAGRPGFAGWFLGPNGPNALPFKTDKGIGVGSTVAQMQAAYGGDVTTSHGEQGAAFFISTPSGLQITGQLTTIGPQAKVTNIQAGSYCGPA
ncbi:MAG TPA: hypothetical protein VHL53_18330 [Acidimicrobiia bacterium]|nr:hypothetical protein [Acidimicrobiia bacterium]